jgi:Transposase DDE domain
MAPPRQPPLKVQDLQGFHYLRHFRDLWQPLRACARDKAGNRTFFYDQYLGLLLLYFFTPTLTSLRGLQQATTLDKVQKTFGLTKAPGLGTLSAAARDFDPALLRPILAELAEHAVPVVDGKEAEALAGLVAVDGSIFPALPKMVWALWMDESHRGVKLHLHFNVFKGVPQKATLTPAACSEIEELEKALEAGLLYVQDRGYACYQLLGDILRAHSSFIARLKEDAAFVPDSERPIGEAARQAGVVRDVVVQRLGTSHHKDAIGRPVRLVWVRTGKVDKDGQPEVLLLCTDRLELDAELVALGYKYRWWIELFFRWLKCIIGCRHLLSTDRDGVTLQIYAALIASLLVSLCTARKPTKRTFEMLCFFFAGWATAEELQRHLENLVGKEENSS